MSNIKEIDRNSNSSFIRFSYCPFYRGVRYSEVFVSQELTVLALKVKAKGQLTLLDCITGQRILSLCLTIV